LTVDSPRAAGFSFDVVSKVDLQEVANAVQQASKEIATRFDFAEHVEDRLGREGAGADVDLGRRGS
jgi:uncharacterized protein YajQ (UPF0234 family)